MWVADESGTQSYYGNTTQRNDTNRLSSTTRNQADPSLLQRAARHEAEVFGGTAPAPFQSDYGVGTDGWLNDNQIYNGVNTHNAFATNGWSGNSAFLNSAGERLNYYGGQVTNADPSPYPTPTNNNNRSGGGSYYGGYSQAEQEAIWEEYYKRYLGMIAGYDIPDVGARPVDDFTDLIVARDVGARPEDVYTSLIKRRDVGARPEDAWSSVIRDTGEETLARSRSNWGSVAPRTTNAFAASGGGRTYASTAGAYGGGLLAGQGMDTASVRQNQIRHQSDLDAGASNWENLRLSNAAMVDQSNAGANADVAALGANSLSNINTEMTSALRRAGLLHEENIDDWEQRGLAADNDYAAAVAASEAQHATRVSEWEQAGRDALYEQHLAKLASQGRYQNEVDEWEQSGLAAKNKHNEFLMSSGLGLLQQMMSAGIDVSKLDIPDWLVGV